MIAEDALVLPTVATSDINVFECALIKRICRHPVESPRCDLRSRTAPLILQNLERCCNVGVPFVPNSIGGAPQTYIAGRPIEEGCHLGHEIHNGWIDG